LAHWFKEQPGYQIHIDVTLIFHPSGWEPLSYVSSQAPLFTQTCRSAASTPAAAAGSSAVVTGASSRAGSGVQDGSAATYGPYADHTRPCLYQRLVCPRRV
jgi:hypothetical protein